MSKDALSLERREGEEKNTRRESRGFGEIPPGVLLPFGFLIDLGLCQYVVIAILYLIVYRVIRIEF